MDLAESQGKPITVSLLDWGKAFDKVSQAKLFQVLRRMKVAPDLINILSQMYNQPKFRVKTQEGKSEYKQQHSDIRQGCPLSPYLFVIVMTAMTKDIRTRLHTPRHREAIEGIEFSEMFCADDTLLFGT